jgi:hypothetical protein
LRERAPRLRFLAEPLGIFFLVVWFFTHSARPNDESLIVLIQWALVFAACNLFTALAPYLRRAPEVGLWQWNFHLGFRFCLTTLYAAILTAGLKIALAGANGLFELHLEHAYLDLWLVLAGGLWPIFFLADIPVDFAALEPRLSTLAENLYPIRARSSSLFTAQSSMPTRSKLSRSALGRTAGPRCPF